MIVVRIMGGIGNQLFQYALYLELLSRGFEAAVDISWYENYSGRELSLIKDFDLKMRYAEETFVKKIADIENTYISKIRKHLFRKNTHYIENYQVFNEKVFLFRKIDNVYLDGYWGAEKYFSGNILKIKELYFPNNKREKYRNLLAEKYGLDRRFIAVHIRRGDYKNNLLINPVYLLPDKYFHYAFRQYKERLNNSICVVFSDNIEDAKEIMKNYSCYYVDWTSSAIEDFYLMASCDDHIISNSTFSFWAAYLGFNESAMNYYPALWFRHIPENNTIFRFPEKWIKVSL
jgi:hypothetical protein